MKKSKEYIQNIVLNGSVAEKKELYGFDSQTNKRIILKKFKIFARGNYPRYFTAPQAKFHDDMIMDMIKSYYGENRLNIAFRGSAKTTLKKLFDVFILLNDNDAHKKYIKVLTGDFKNATQVVTDVYNLIVELQDIYGNVFEKEGKIKREETRTSFTMKKGVKYAAGTVGQKQRGHGQDAYRPDWIWGDDLEDVMTIRSITITQGIIDSWGEAIDGLAKGGSYFVTANYISDQGTIEHIKRKPSVTERITPILEDKKPTWEYYSLEDIEQLKKDSNDFYGEYMCDPSRSVNKFFDIERIERDLKQASEPINISAGVKYWSNYKPHHRYGAGSDHSEGIGLDSNTLILFDFTTGEIVVTYANNEIAPDISAHEFARVGAEFGNCIYAPETNNKCGGTVITTLKQIDYPNIFMMESVGKIADKQTGKLGWETNSRTKYNMFHEFRTDYNDGLIKIPDKNVLREMKAYSNADLKEEKAGLITRHFDLLTAAVIAWQMRKHSVQKESASKRYRENYNKYIES